MKFRIRLLLTCVLLSFTALPLSARQLPIQSEKLRAFVRQVTPASQDYQYYAVILFEHKVFNYAFGTMQMATMMLRRYKFPGPVIVLMRQTRYWADRQIIKHTYRRLAAPVFLDTAGIFEDLHLPPRMMPMLTIWNAQGQLLHSMVLAGLLRGQFFQHLVENLEKWDPLRPELKKVLPEFQEQSFSYTSRFDNSIHALPELRPMHTVALQDDSTTTTGRLQGMRCSPSSKWLVMEDLDQEMLRIYDLRSGKEIQQITTSDSLQRALCRVPIDSAGKLVSQLGLLTQFMLCFGFFPTSDTLATVHFYTVIDSFEVQPGSGDELDTSISLGKRYILVLYTPPDQKSRIIRQAEIQFPDAPTYVGVDFLHYVIISSWHTALLPVSNWKQKQMAWKVNLPNKPYLNPQSAEFEANDPLVWEFDLSTGKFLGHYGDLPQNRQWLGIGYWKSFPLIDCDTEDCGYLNLFSDSLLLLRSDSSYQIQAYYPESILRPWKYRDQIPEDIKKRRRWFKYNTPIEPIDLTLTPEWVSVVWYHFGTGDIVWQIYQRQPFQLWKAYRLRSPIAKKESVLAAPLIDVDRRLRLYCLDQDARKTVVTIFEIPAQ